MEHTESLAVCERLDLLEERRPVLRFGFGFWACAACVLVLVDLAFWGFILMAVYFGLIGIVNRLDDIVIVERAAQVRIRLNERLQDPADS